MLVALVPGLAHAEANEPPAASARTVSVTENLTLELANKDRGALAAAIPATGSLAY